MRSRISTSRAVSSGKSSEGEAGFGAEKKLINLLAISGPKWASPNRFSLVEGDGQLLWESRFSPPEAAYYLARMSFRSKEVRAQMKEPPKALFTRLRDRFLATPPLHGIEAPRLTLERWTDRGRGTRPVNDPGKAREMAARLVRAWGSFVPDELPPSQEAHEWSEAGGEKARKPRKQPRNRER